MRYLYSFLLYLILPFLILRLWWRGKAQPAYGQRLGERVGIYPGRLNSCIWVHAVSVGEAIASVPLLKKICATYPSLPLLVTTMTPTGAARVVAALGDEVKHAYLPYDTPTAIARFLNMANPVIGIIMETELWPNLLAACEKRKVPMCLLNGRLSEKSAKGYSRIQPLTRQMLQSLQRLAAYGQADSERFISLGADPEKVIVTGNIKFDMALPPHLHEQSASLRAALGKERFVWIAASTHEGEEAILLAAHQRLLKKVPNSLLIIVPRHPERFDAVALLAQEKGVAIRRSSGKACDMTTTVYVGDTMGELMLLYGAADAAFVGGSLITRGGHNALEPALLGKPILTGPHWFNFAEINPLLMKAGALIEVQGENDLVQQLISLATHPHSRLAMGECALQVIETNRGALDKQFAVVQQLLDKVGVH